MKNEWLDDKIVVSDDPRRVPADPKALKGPDKTLVLTGGRIFDGTGKPIFNGSIVLERNKVKAVLPAGSTDWPSDAELMDLNGKTVLPGLIDMHTHLTDSDQGLPISITLSEADQTLRGLERMRYYIESGITSVRDVGSHGSVPFRLKEWSAQNRIPGPRVFAAGQFITGTGGHAAQFLDERNAAYGLVIEASGPDDWRNTVRKMYKNGADLIKTGSHFSKEEIKAAIDEAHALNIKITSDAERYYVQWAVEAGIDMIEHCLPCSDEAIKLMAENKVDVIPTLLIYDIIDKYVGGYYGSTTRKFQISKRGVKNHVKKLKKAGIKLGIGTDLSLNMFRYLPDPYIGELVKFLQVGFKTEETLIASTRINAEILGMDDKLGTLEPGKLADVLIIDGKPDQDLFALRNVDMVIKDGFIVVKNGCLNVERHPEIEYPKEQTSEFVL